MKKLSAVGIAFIYICGIINNDVRLSSGSSSGVEHQLPKLGVAGSIPVSRSTGYAHVAQSAERRLGKAEVTGSIPVMGSIFV